MTNNKKNANYLFYVASALSIALLSGCQDNQTYTSLESSEVSKKADVFANETVLKPLFNVKQKEQLNWLSSDGANASVIDDKQLKITFSASENISKLRIQPELPWSLTGLAEHNLAFEVKNISKNSTHFYLLVENQNGEYQSRSIAIPENYDGTVYLPLKGREAETETGFWGDAPPWQTKDNLMVWRSWRSEQVDLSKIRALTFQTIGLIEDAQISVSDIRIRQNPATDPNWMKGVLDKYGQNAKYKTALHINDDNQLINQTQTELVALETAKPNAERSRFGGYKAGPKLDATGYFRTEKVNGKWGMVDPEGYVFFSHGPANVRMANLSTLTGYDFKDDRVRHRSSDELTPEDSIGVVQVADQIRATKFLSSELRRDLFEWLPEYHEPLAKHYSYRRTPHKGTIPSGETYNFYRAHLETKYGDDFM